jgi:multidrug efflux system outer membrane protein
MSLPSLLPRAQTRKLAPLGMAVLMAVLMAGCTLAPTYERPALPVPAALPSGGAYGLAQPAPTPAADVRWRDFFTDPKLRRVIQLALDNNRDLRVAVLNVAEARAQYRVQRSALAPHINANFDPTIEHLPASVLGAEAGVNTSTLGVSANQSVDIQYYQATLGVSSYELDLWGRVRSLSRQALEQYFATEEARRAAQISLISQVATAYVTYAADLERLDTAQRTVDNDKTSLNLTQQRFNAGVASELDVRQAQSALEQANAGVSTYTTTVAQDVNALRLLVGADVPSDLLPTPLQDQVVTLPDLPAGLSSELLLRRPDVMEAEHQLKGYNANIGAARAAFFPTIELTGGGGSTSTSLSRLFGPASGAWTFTPTVTLPIFSGGRNVANLNLAKAQKEMAVAQYEKAVQTAFREVADALAQHGQIASLVSANEREVDAVSHSFSLSSARYQRGSDTYLNVLNAQVTLFQAQQNLIAARLTRAVNLITLYQTLGGGAGPDDPPKIATVSDKAS